MAHISRWIARRSRRPRGERGQPMSTPLWLPVAVALPVLFSIWTVFLITSVRELRDLVERDVRVTSRLTALEREVRAVQRAAQAQDARAQADQWIRLRKSVVDAVDSIDDDAEGTRAIAAEVRQIEEAVRAADADAAAVGRGLNPGPAGGPGARTTDMLEGSAAALAIVRSRLAQQSIALGGKWTQLTFAAGGSVLLAFLFALVLVQYERTRREVGTLRGILPICVYCKRVRDDANYWEQVDRYIAHHSDVRFSHGICPSCFDKMTVEGFDAIP